MADIADDGEDVPLPGSDGDDDSADGADDLDGEDWPPREETVPFTRVLLPRIRVVWPGGAAPALSSLDATGLCEPVAQLPELADALTEAVTRSGPGNLAPDGVRWSAEQGWQLMLTPAYDTSGGLRPAGAAFDEGALAAAWRRDQQSVAAALVACAVTRPPSDVRDARRLVDVAAGDLPQGLDALVNLLLNGGTRTADTGGLRRLAEALGRRTDGPLSVRCYLESVVGSRKAKGRPDLDNEDAAVAEVGADGAARLAVFDGITGDGSGSGHFAANAARAEIVRQWADRVDDPVALLRAADRAVLDTTMDGGSTAVVVTVEPGGAARVASVGDSSAWIVRPSQDKGPYVWRMTPAHTVYAGRLRLDPNSHGGYSDVTRYLGGAADHPFAARFTMCRGDLLVLATDGATSEQSGEWFGAALQNLARTRMADGRPIGAGVAADLVARAESLGGWDNATVLVAEFDEA